MSRRGAEPDPDPDRLFGGDAPPFADSLNSRHHGPVLKFGTLVPLKSVVSVLDFC